MLYSDVVLCSSVRQPMSTRRASSDSASGFLMPGSCPLTDPCAPPATTGKKNAKIGPLVSQGMSATELNEVADDCGGLQGRKVKQKCR